MFEEFQHFVSCIIITYNNSLNCIFQMSPHTNIIVESLILLIRLHFIDYMLHRLLLKLPCECLAIKAQKLRAVFQ